MPGILFDMGIYKRKAGKPVPRQILDPMVDLAQEIVGSEPYRFSAETEIYQTMFDLKGQYFSELTDVSLPPDMVFVNRSLSGLFGNLCRLEAEGLWRDELEEFIR
ncbi:MAG: hypothetical protein ACC642_02060 [Pseudomonadales bacterium]